MMSGMGHKPPFELVGGESELYPLADVRGWQARGTILCTSLAVHSAGAIGLRLGGRCYFMLNACRPLHTRVYFTVCFPSVFGPAIVEDSSV